MLLYVFTSCFSVSGKTSIEACSFASVFETQGLTEPKQTVFMYKDNWFQTGFQGTTVVEYVAVLLIQCLNMLEFSHCFLIVYYPSVPLLRPETSRILPQFFPHHLQHDWRWIRVVGRCCYLQIISENMQSVRVWFMTVWFYFRMLLCNSAFWLETAEKSNQQPGLWELGAHWAAQKSCADAMVIVFSPSVLV